MSNKADVRVLLLCVSACACVHACVCARACFACFGCAFVCVRRAVHSWSMLVVQWMCIGRGVMQARSREVGKEERGRALAQGRSMGGSN